MRPFVHCVAMTVAIAIAAPGCLTYYVAKENPAVSTGAVLFGTEVVLGAGFGAVIYRMSNKIERLPLAASIAVGIGAALLLDAAITGLVAITQCEQDPECRD